MRRACVEEVVSVAEVVLPRLAGLLEPLSRELTHGLEEEASAGRLGDDEAVVDEHLDLVEGRAQ